MKSFHNDPAVKEKYVSRVAAHAKADQLVQGTGWEGRAALSSEGESK
jgi:hypothetical protein